VDSIECDVGAAPPLRLCSDTVSADIPTLAVTGFALGWSVAWPPGPINAEMVRRGLSRGFWPAYAVGLGASSGDFLWALLITLGAGVVVGLPGVRAGMIVTSTVLLLVLCSMFLRGAIRSWRVWRSGQPLPEGRVLDSTRGGYFLGLGMALSSPWNVAFWIAVVGNTQSGEALSLGRSLLVAVCVVLGACAWSLVLSGAMRMGARFATPLWDAITQGATSALMLAFATRGFLRMVSSS
jgi:threonine/homoserine/homoserine lactone efflux protein